MQNRLLRIAGTIILVAGFVAAPAYCQAVPRWNAAPMGAVADETTDNTAALQKALNAAGKAGGGVVELAAGRYRVKGTLSVPAGVTLQGTYRVPPTSAGKSEKPDGTVLLAYAGRGSERGAPFLRLAGRNSAIAGLVVIYPEWKQSDVPPVPYPSCVESHDTDNVGIMECCFLNPYEAIIQGCTFSKKGTHVQVGERVRSAILTANQGQGGFRAENHAGARLQMFANEQNP